MLGEDERAENDTMGLGRELRPTASRALQALADLLRRGDGRTMDADLKSAAEDSLSKLVEQIARVRARSPHDELFTASSIVTSIRRCLEMPRPQQ